MPWSTSQETTSQDKQLYSFLLIEMITQLTPTAFEHHILPQLSWYLSQSFKSQWFEFHIAKITITDLIMYISKG